MIDLQAFYATFSASGLTLLGLWWVVVDKHPEWFERPDTARMAYVISLQFMVPAVSSLLSLVALDTPTLWRSIFGVLAVIGVVGAALVARLHGGRGHLGRGAVFLAAPLYLLVGLVAAVPTVGRPMHATGLEIEAFLSAGLLLLGLNAVWFFTHQPADRSGR